MPEKLYLSYVILGFTVLITFLAWNNQNIMNRSLFHPFTIKRENQWDRFITHGFLHADQMHLIFNMFTFYFFAPYVEQVFEVRFGSGLWFVAFYLIAIIVSSIPTYFRHKDNSSYAALGASGAVSAVLFFAIALMPWEKLYLFAVLPIPAIIFAVLYIWYSQRMDKRGTDNIGHSAHLWGALFGFITPFILNPAYVTTFIERITHPKF